MIVAPFGSHGDPEVSGAALAREDAWEHLDDVRRLAGVAQEFLIMGDDRGANYTIARLTINLQHIAKAARLIQRGAGK